VKSVARQRLREARVDAFTRQQRQAPAPEVMPPDPFQAGPPKYSLIGVTQLGRFNAAATLARRVNPRAYRW
jgi:hypothetical protein